MGVPTIDLKQQTISVGIRAFEYTPLVTPKVTPRNHHWRQPVISGPGLLLFTPKKPEIFANREAIQILFYPDNPPEGGKLHTIMADLLPRNVLQTASPSTPPITLISGRRRYTCSGHVLEVPATKRKTIVVLLERISPCEITVYRLAEQFKLSRREHEALQHLSRGLTTKEIAHEMNISPNTAKAFLRCVMIKMDATNRMGLLQRLMTAR